MVVFNVDASIAAAAEPPPKFKLGPLARSVKLLARSTFALVLSVPPPVSTVFVPRRVIPPVTVSDFVAATLTVPLDVSKVRVALPITSDRSTWTVPVLRICALSAALSALPYDRISPLAALVSVPALTFNVDVPRPQPLPKLARSSEPLLVKPLVTVKVPL